MLQQPHVDQPCSLHVVCETIQRESRSNTLIVTDTPLLNRIETEDSDSLKFKLLRVTSKSLTEYIEKMPECVQRWTFTVAWVRVALAYRRSVSTLAASLNRRSFQRIEREDESKKRIAHIFILNTHSLSDLINASKTHPGRIHQHD